MQCEAEKFILKLRQGAPTFEWAFRWANNAARTRRWCCSPCSLAGPEMHGSNGRCQCATQPTLREWTGVVALTAGINVRTTSARVAGL